MAPKRASSKASAGPAAKRAKADAAIVGKCSKISDAVKAAPGYPKQILHMVAGMVNASLQTVKEERHEFAEGSIKMIDEVLQASRTSLAEQVASLETKVSESDAEKTSRSTASEAATALVAEKTEALAAAKEALAAAVQERDAAKVAHSEAEQAKKSGALLQTEAVEKKAKLELVLNGDYGTLKQTTVSKLVKAFIKFAKDFDFEATLVDAAESSLSKSPCERGTFDTMVLQEIDTAFSNKIAALEEVISNEAPAKAEREAAAEAAAARFSAAGEDELAKKAAVAEAQAAAKEAEAGKKAADRAVKDFGPEMKRAAAELAAAGKELAEFDKVLASFTELVERTAPAPEPEPEAAAEEPEVPLAPEDAAAKDAVEGQAS